MEKEAMSSFGFEKLDVELKDLKDNQRPAIVVEIDVARSHGGLKENAGYHAIREKQALIGNRIAELGGVLSRTQVIDPASYPHDSVKFGSSVLTMDLKNEKEGEYTPVGTCGSDLEEGYVSITLSLVRVMLGKKEGDEFKVRLPKGEDEFGIISIAYKSLEF